MFGFVVYDSFECPRGGEDRRGADAARPRAQLGGHAVMAVGYDERKQRFIVRNSWGKNWGMNGYFTLPYPYLLQPSLFERLLDNPSRGVVAA